MGAPALIYCAAGNPAFRRIARDAGWLNGARLPDTVYDPPLYFADQEYKNPNRSAYMRAVAEHRPEMATVLDWQREEEWPEVLNWAEEISQWVRRVVIIPKVSDMLDKIPERIGGAMVVLGYSVPTSYGGTDVPLWEFGRRPVHLLGGSPQKQMKLASYLNVVSADGSMAQQQAIRGRFWSRRPWGPRRLRWVQLRDIGDDRAEGAHLEAFRLSCRNIMEAWQLSELNIRR